MSKLLDGLNPAQREAVTHTIGPLLIIAGPGSGKTRTVVHSIAYAIENGVQPDRILAFSFTGKACEDLKKRVKEFEFIGEEKGDLVQIFTFHRFCRWVLRKDIEELRKGYTRNFKELKSEEQKQIVSAQIAKVRVQKNINLLQHRKFLDTNDILNFITRCKLQFIPPQEAGERVPNSEMPPEISRAYVEIYKRYEWVLETNKWIDYANQLLLANELLRDVDDVRTKWQEKFELIFVDEYQDTDPVQYCIVKTLSGYHQNVHVVGDDDQGIYGWRGADIQNILNFEKDYLNPKIISLGQNYRSTQRIVEASRALAEFNPDRRAKQLFTRNFEGENVKHLHSKNAEEEINTIVSFIICAIQNGWSSTDFAILCRLNKQVDMFNSTFNSLGIPQCVDGVSVMTIHKAKGLEFPNVFVAGVCKDLLPFAENDQNEERRLLYVAMTRAENWLCLSSYENGVEPYANGKSPFFDQIPRHRLEPIQILDDSQVPPLSVKFNKTELLTNVERPIELEKCLSIRTETVLGIDPGKIDANRPNVGWAVTQKSSDGYTVIEYNTESPNGTLNAKLKQIEHQINMLIEVHQLDSIAVERLEGAADEGLNGVAGCVALIRYIANQHDIECAFYSPQQIKYAATRDRHADKELVQEGVKRRCNFLPDQKNVNDLDGHSSDAIAASLCYLDSYLNSTRLQWEKRKQEHYDSGLTYLSNGQYDVAVVEFKKAIDTDPIYVDAHCGLGRAYLAHGDLDRGENVAKLTLRLDANHPPTLKLLDEIKQAYYDRAFAYLKVEQYNKAIAEFDTVLNKYPNFINAHCRLGETYLAQGNLRKAENPIKEALKLDSSFQPAIQVLDSIKQKYCELARDYLNRSDLIEAENLAKESIRLDSSFQPALELLEGITQAYYNRGCNHLANQRYGKAITEFKEALSRNSSFTSVYCGLANAYLGQGSLRYAENYIQEALKLDNNYQPALQILESIKQKYCRFARDYFNRDDLTAAENNANEAIRLEKDYQPALQILESIKQTYCELARGYLNKDSLTNAENNANEAIRLEKDYQPALQILESIKQTYCELARGYLNKDSLTNAENNANEAIRLEKNYQPAYKLLSEIKKAHFNQAKEYFSLGNILNAEKSARITLRFDNNFPPANKLLKTIMKAYYKKMYDYIIQDNLTAAEKLVKETLKLDINNLTARELLHSFKEANCILGSYHLDNQRYGESIAAFEEVLNKFPIFIKAHCFITAHCGLGRAYLEQDKLVEAEKSVYEALKTDSNYLPALKILESIKQRSRGQERNYLNKNEIELVEKTSKQTLKLDANYRTAHELLNLLIKIHYNGGCLYLDYKKYSEAITQFKIVAGIDSNYEKIQYYLGYAYYWTKDFYSAISSFSKAIKMDSNDIKAYIMLGLCYIWNGNYESAINQFQKVVNNDPNCILGYLGLGRTYLKQKRFQDAKQAVMNALQIDSTYHRTHNLLIEIEKQINLHT